MIEINFPSGIDTVFSATAPVAPVRGKRWCDTTSGLVYTWTGTEWAELEGVPPQLCMGWPRSLEGSIPAGWMACDGTNGTPTQSDTGALMWIMRHGGTVATPTLTPGAGTYGSTQSVTLACATSGATIKFTTDGSTPSRSHGTTYSSAISVASTTTIKAIAYKDGMIDSAVASATYTLADTTAPTVSSRTIPTGGTTLVVVHSEIVTHGAGGNGGHTLAATGGAVTAAYASGAGTNTLTYNLSRTIASGETVTHSYTQPGNGVEDAAGNDLATFSAQAVTNNSTQSAGFTPPSGTFGWWKADAITGLVNNDPVSAWNDSSTSGYNVANSGSGRPTYKTGLQNGLPGVRFDGSDDVLYFDAGFGARSQPFAVHCVMAFKNLATASAPFGIWPGTGATTMLRYSDGSLSINAGSYLNSAAGALADTNAHQFTFVFNGSSSQIILDGTVVASGDAGSGGNQTNPMLGAKWNGGGFDFAQVDLFEVIYRDGTRDTATESGLKAKWGTP